MGYMAFLRAWWLPKGGELFHPSFPAQCTCSAHILEGLN